MSQTSTSIIIISLTLFALISCKQDPPITIDEPATYSFTRDGASTVSFSGQTTRINMGEELIAAMRDFDQATETSLLEMFRNETETGGDANPFSLEALNASDKSIKSKTAASRDYFSTNTATSSLIKADFENWISLQVSEVFPNEAVIATPGTAGQIADGSSTRYVSGKGLEYNQAVNKSLIGALMADQMLNNYLSASVLDEGNNREDNENGVLTEGENYTEMEHKWDEAYGYLYGNAANAADPNGTIGNDDNFLNEYVGRVEEDPDFAGIAATIYEAFKLGRAAIVAGDYEVRNEQADIIREHISTVIAVRAVYYLQQGKNDLEKASPDYGSAFHNLSEAYGFIYSLQFTRKPNSGDPYLSKTEVDSLLEDLMGEGENGLWDVTPATLEAISTAIADQFTFTVEQAAS